MQILIILSIPVGEFAHASEIDGLKNQIEERNKEIKELKQKEGEYKQAATDAHEAAGSLTELITDYNAQIRSVEGRIYIAQKEITTITLQVKRTELEILAKEENIKRIHAYIAAVLREIYEDSDEEITAMMFKYDDFSEFFNQVKYRDNLQTELKIS